MHKRKVLHVFGQMERGGAELRTLATMEPLKTHNVQLEFVVLSGLAGVLDQQIIDAGGKVHYCQLGLTFPFRFYKLLKQHSFDTVHSHVAMVSGFILLVAWFAGIKQRIAHFRNTHDTGLSSLIRRIRNRLLHKFIDIFATNILGVCNAALDIFWRKNWRQDPRCATVYNGLAQPESISVDKSFWQQFSLPENAKVIINVARMAPQKNHLFMVDIIAELQQQKANTYLVFIGKEEPELKQQLIAKAEQLGCRQQLIFASEQANVYPFIAHADAMLFPSMWEGLPGAVIEAASTGLPVIASDVPGVVEISQYLPCVRYLSTTDPISLWCQQVQIACQQTPEVRKKSLQQFNNSPFNIAQCIKALNDTYR